MADVSTTAVLDALTIARAIESLYAYLAERQGATESGDVFIKVEYRLRGEYVALFGIQPYGRVADNPPLSLTVGRGPSYEAALLSLWSALADVPAPASRSDHA